MESIGFTCEFLFYCKFSRFRTFYTSKTSLERKQNFRLSRGIAGGFWTKFEAQLAQPCECYKVEILATSLI
jgi:hypothetical protein